MAHRYDVVVVGGGHAGAEAAWVASKLGADTALVTMQYDAIGRMSCNPAIGGLGKGQMVREVDALGGLMAMAIDRAGIQFRMLNRSKGPAVWAPRAQADRKAYTNALHLLLGEARSLDIIEGSVEKIATQTRRGWSQSVPHPVSPPSGLAKRDGALMQTGSHNGRRPGVSSVTLEDGRVLKASAVVLTTGTFLRGLMHCGEEQTEGGRSGEPAAVGLSDALRSLGFELGRLKTGTPPRVHRDSIDYDACEIQPGDEVPTPFSYMTDRIAQPQVDCWITWTNARVHEPIHANLHRAPLYSGQINSTGPRYCPSIEDKIIRFADKPKHQIFLEPEGYDNERIYCNGISTSLPKDVQEAFVHEVPGLRQAEILQYGYAIEYDFVPTHQIKTSLETKRIDGLFLAGQINGTSGYEEAAGQGIVAGVNAVRRLREEGPFVLGRDEAYVGVMIDDLITRPPTEPYRMFTSRAEYRLRLRADNADQRLTPIGRALGTVDDQRWERYQRKREAMAVIEGLCDTGRINGMALRTWVRRPDADVAAFAEALARISERTFCTDALRQVLVDAKYSGYVERQDRQIERFRRLESMTIPERIDYSMMPGLRREAREWLARTEPRTLGQAARLSGISPADITVLRVYLKSRRSSSTPGPPNVREHLPSLDRESLLGPLAGAEEGFSAQRYASH
ncbi:MAG: tRNA uridine-5-carboxymethylaminomethyl(34) synthesis enzyme MnmG [Phycisphaerae bacterium]